MRDPHERVRDMIRAIGNIDRRAGRGRAGFDTDELVQTFVVYHLQTMSEAAYKMPAEFCAAWPGVPWAKIQGMRHILVHDYYRIDLDIVWNVVENELPGLRAGLDAILRAVAPAEGGGDGE